MSDQQQVSTSDSKDVVSEPDSDSDSRLPDEINPKKLLFQTILALIALGAILTVISIYFKEPVEAWSKSFIAMTGLWGVALGFMLPDAFTLPIPPDTFLLAGYMGGLDFLPVAISASIGSIAGGTLGFLMIRQFSEKTWVQTKLGSKLEWGKKFMSRYGSTALAVAALTPLPYSVICGEVRRAVVG
jgi:membrane protein YqaA with SNARE-associated domain